MFDFDVRDRGKGEGDRSDASNRRAREPERESALLQAAVCAALQGKADEELPLLQRLIDVNPRYSFYWIRLADVRAAQNDWPAARAAAEQALALNPAASEARRTLIQALVRGGEIEQARRHFAIYEALGGKDTATVRGWVQR